MKYNVEFYYKGEAIEIREYNDFFVAPQVGDVISLQFSNPSYNELGHYWLVTERRVLFFDSEPKSLLQTLMLNVTPDSKKGMWKTDPLYNEELKVPLGFKIS